MLFAYSEYGGIDENTDNVYILDTDDFILQSINYLKLRDYIKSGRVYIENVFYDEKDEELHISDDFTTLLDINSVNSKVIKSLDERIVIKDDGVTFNYNTLSINGVVIEPDFVLDTGLYDEDEDEDSYKGYIFKVNNIDIARFCPSEIEDDFRTIDDMIDVCFIGFDLVYMLNKNTVAVKYIIIDESYHYSILLLFNIDGTFIDSYEYENSIFERLENREISGIVAKLKTLNKGVI